MPTFQPVGRVLSDYGDCGEDQLFTGFMISDDRTFFIVPEERIGREHLFSTEKLGVVLAVFKYTGWDMALDMVRRIVTSIEYHPGTAEGNLTRIVIDPACGTSNEGSNND